MKHVLLTKFAVRFAEDNPRRRYEQKPGWIDYRMDLFKRYCLPSVQAQTYKEFDWWFLVDAEFPGLKKEHLNELSKHGKVLWLSANWNEAQPEVGEQLANEYKDEWVCSTKLDSDDMLHKEFMEMLMFETQEKEQWISFEYGYIIKDGKAALRKYVVNPFISYVEYASPFKSVLHVAHTKANKTKAPFETIPLIAWAQVDHGDNIKNHAFNKVKNFSEVAIPISNLKGFPL